MFGSGRRCLALVIMDERAFGRGSSAEVQNRKPSTKERSNLRSHGPMVCVRKKLSRVEMNALRAPLTVPANDKGLVCA